MRKLFLFAATCAIAGCVSTPSTKALITPVGAVSYHTFAPPQSPDRTRTIDLEALNQVARADDTAEQ